MVPLDQGDETMGEVPHPPHQEAEHPVEEQEEFLKNLQSELSPAEFRALSLYMEGLTIAEIAARENKSEKSCENAVQRAKRKVAASLQRQ